MFAHILLRFADLARRTKPTLYSRFGVVAALAALQACSNAPPLGG